MSALRAATCRAGIPDAVPIHVEENGWPDGPGPHRGAPGAGDAARWWARCNDYRGTYNVTDYRWFDLRERRHARPNFQQHYGLLRDDYSPKPAFEAYRALVASLARREAAPSGTRPRLALRLRSRIGRSRGRPCARRPVRGHVVGSDVASVRRVLFRLGPLSAGGDVRAPFSRRLPVPRSGRPRIYRVRARVRLRDGRLLTLRRNLRACPG